MKRIFLFANLIFSFISQAQSLSFDSLGTGYSPSYCRSFSHQNGGGVVFAAATGGVNPYQYQWTNLATLQTSSNSTWGGLNPGDYEIKIWDGANDTITQIIALDSLNPIADFDVVSSDLSLSGSTYIGSAPVNASFVDQSLNAVDPNDPTNVGTYVWKMTQFQTPYFETTNITQNYTYNYGGDWYVQLELINGNGCSDVMIKHLDLNGPAEIQNHNNLKPSVYYDPISADIIVQIPDNSEILYAEIYDLTGLKISTTPVQQGNNSINVDFNNVVLLYSCKNASGDSILNGKLVVPSH